MSEIIPFGKYKNQPVAALAEDPGYRDWLMNQPWFHARFPSIHTLIINNFGPPAETPEHNALQALFSNNAFVNRFVWAYLGDRWWEDRKATIISDAKRKPTQIEEMPDQIRTIELNTNRSDYQQERLQTFYDQQSNKAKKRIELDAALDHLSVMPRPIAEFQIEFEVSGADVVIRNVCLIEKWNLWTPIITVECKPSLSDDYPAVLRQIRALRSPYATEFDSSGRMRAVAPEWPVLFVGAGGYTGLGATIEQVRKIFGDIRIIFLADLKPDRT